MNIGYITPYFSPKAGGAAISQYKLALKLSNNNNISIYTTDLFRNESKFVNESNFTIYENSILFSILNFYYAPTFSHCLEREGKNNEVYHFNNFRFIL